MYILYGITDESKVVLGVFSSNDEALAAHAVILKEYLYSAQLFELQIEQIVLNKLQTNYLW